MILQDSAHDMTLAEALDECRDAGERRRTGPADTIRAVGFALMAAHAPLAPPRAVASERASLYRDPSCPLCGGRLHHTTDSIGSRWECESPRCYYLKAGSLMEVPA